jgi:hypothetical protein
VETPRTNYVLAGDPMGPSVAAFSSFTMLPRMVAIRAAVEDAIGTLEGVHAAALHSIIHEGIHG